MKHRRYFNGHYSRRTFYEYESEVLSLDPVNKKLAGVCAGVARYLDIPSLVVRIGALISLCVFPQVTLIAYGLAYIILEPRV